jgi:hypothetical protein
MAYPYRPNLGSVHQNQFVQPSPQYSQEKLRGRRRRQPHGLAEVNRHNTQQPSRGILSIAQTAVLFEELPDRAGRPNSPSTGT